jgi:hypothetical protein
LSRDGAGEVAALTPSGASPAHAQTDLEAFGFARGYLRWPRRDWLLTIDLEAFTPATTSLWTHAMDAWAARSGAHGHRFSIFVSVEDLVRLRSEDEDAYRAFLASMLRMAEAGCEFHPHNHCTFDVHDGTRPYDPGPDDPPVPGYNKRPSMFYDVVRRQGRDLSEWLAVVIDQHRRVLDDAGIDPPARLAFRAGGFDNGSSRADLELYIDALAQNGVEFDSSASGGGFGTRRERLTSSFGRNVVALPQGVVETAPCLMLDCGAPFVSRSSLGSVRRLAPQARALLGGRDGLFVGVLHLDHLFHRRPGRAYELFSVTSQHEVEARIDRFFGLLDRLQGAFRFGSATFGNLSVEAGAPLDRSRVGAVERPAASA